MFGNPILFCVFPLFWLFISHGRETGRAENRERADKQAKTRKKIEDQRDALRGNLWRSIVTLAIKKKKRFLIERISIEYLVLRQLFIFKKIV